MVGNGFGFELKRTLRTELINRWWKFDKNIIYTPFCTLYIDVVFTPFYSLFSSSSSSSSLRLFNDDIFNYKFCDMIFINR